MVFLIVFTIFCILGVKLQHVHHKSCSSADDKIAHVYHKSCPSVDGRIQLRPGSRDKLMDICYKQWDYERRNVTGESECGTEIKCMNSKYRTADGSCNNIRNPSWGKSMECLNRLQKAVYADGNKLPKVAKSGHPLPNVRLISNRLHFQINRFSHVSHMLMQWGQFLDHDISFTPAAQLADGVVDCCTQTNDECFPISISSDDAFYSNFTRKCMTFVRSAPCLTCNVKREQINTLTAFIDASNVYGSSENETFVLRKFDGTGMLRSQNNSLLPQSIDPANDQCSDLSHNSICFAAGDNRVNILPSLIAMHTLFMRHHNRLCSLLKRINPKWDEETLFQEARRIVGAQMQVITFKEFLPLVLGFDYMGRYDLHLYFYGRSEYNANINPTIYTEFSTAAYRFGHTLIDGKFHSIASGKRPEAYLLRDNYFNPKPLYDGNIDSVVRGLTGSQSQKFDPWFTDDVRNFLYKLRNDLFGDDLVSFNLQRGRDHAISGYTVYVHHCTSIVITTFADLAQIMPIQRALEYSQIYESVHDIDLFSGMISEYSVAGGIVGPTMACIIADQFWKLRFGDRYWFEHTGQTGSFSDAQLNELRKSTLASIICLNGDNFETIQPRVMEKHTEPNGSNRLTSCKTIVKQSDINLKAWKTKGILNVIKN